MRRCVPRGKVRHPRVGAWGWRQRPRIAFSTVGARVMRRRTVGCGKGKSHEASRLLPMSGEGSDIRALVLTPPPSAIVEEPKRTARYREGECRCQLNRRLRAPNPCEATSQYNQKLKTTITCISRYAHQLRSGHGRSERAKGGGTSIPAFADGNSSSRCGFS